MPIERTYLLGVPADAGSFAAVTEALQNKRGTGHYVIVANVHLLYEANHRKEVMEAFQKASMVVTDGMPLVWLAHNDSETAERITGIVLMDTLAATSPSAFFLGGDEGVAEKVAARYQSRFPGLRIAGTACPPFRALSDEEKAELRGQINRAKPDVLFVALGAPKQELWMAENCPELDVRLTVGVGAAFNYALGNLKRAPLWMQRAGLEWLYRLMQEPRRLLKRYLVTNSWFIWRLLTRG